MITGKISSNDVVGYLKEKIPTLDSGYKMSVTKNYYGIFANGIQVIGGNIEAGDGVVQKIGSLDPPPTQTVLQLIDSLPELSYLAAVVARLPAMQSFFDTLTLRTPTHPFGLPPGFTFFAPTNTAFQSSFYPTLSSISQASPSALTALLNGYIINGFQFTC